MPSAGAERCTRALAGVVAALLSWAQAAPADELFAFSTAKTRAVALGGACVSVEDGLFAETGNSSHLHPPKVTKVPPADGRPPAVSDTGGAADTGPRAREPAWPRPLVPPTPSGARYRLALLVALVTASIAIGVVVLVIALREPSPSAETGAIHVTTTPVSGAEIVLDGRSVGGTTPALISGLEGDSRHEIRVRHSDYGEGVARGVRVVAGGEVELTIELPPLDEP